MYYIIGKKMNGVTDWYFVDIMLEGTIDNSGFELPKVKWSQNKQEAQKYATEKDAKEMWLALGGKKHNYTIYQEVE